MPTVLISTPLRRLTGNQSRVDVPGATAGEIIKNLEVGYQAHQAVRLTLADLPAELLNLSLGRGPAVLYVTTATCAQCRLQQAPALARVQQRRPDLQLVQLDAVDQSALADYDHVMTVPTTVVLNAHRRPVAINHGLSRHQPVPAVKAESPNQANGRTEGATAFGGHFFACGETAPPPLPALAADTFGRPQAASYSSP